jgi:Iap family predicted aminopeptidase
MVSKELFASSFRKRLEILTAANMKVTFFWEAGSRGFLRHLRNA